jgi:hypothetical protein
MRTSILLCSLLLPVSFATLSPQDPTCQVKPCPLPWPGWMPSTVDMMCGPNGFLRCGATSTIPGDPSCNCPSPQVCLDPIRGGSLNNDSRYWNIEGDYGHLKIPSGYCIGKPCSDTPDMPLEKRTCRGAPHGEKCVYKDLEWDHKTGETLKRSKNGYCLEDNDSRSCLLDGRTPGYHCDKGWTCINRFCAPDSLVWE